MDEQKPTPSRRTDEKLFPLYFSPLAPKTDVGKETAYLIKTAVSPTDAVILLSAMIEACRWRAHTVYNWFRRNRLKICAEATAYARGMSPAEPPEELPTELREFYKRTSHWEPFVVGALNSPAFRRLVDQRGAHPKRRRPTSRPSAEKIRAQVDHLTAKLAKGDTWTKRQRDRDPELRTIPPQWRHPAGRTTPRIRSMRYVASLYKVHPRTIQRDCE